MGKVSAPGSPLDCSVTHVLLGMKIPVAVAALSNQYWSLDKEVAKHKVDPITQMAQRES